jgi:hypothetical protein
MSGGRIARSRREGFLSVPDPLISIIVPTYNYAHYLGECLSSILALDGGWDFEVIVIDDASTDDTQEILEPYSAPNFRKVHNTKNLGHIGTITRGLEMARGSYIARIDPDDRYHANFFNDVIPALEANPSVGLVYGAVQMIDSEGHDSGLVFDDVHDRQPFTGNQFIRLLGHNFICAAGSIARAEAWRQALPIPQHLAFNDWYFTLMISRHWDQAYVPEVLADYRVHPGNHHSKIVLDGSEKSSILWLLDTVYATPETDPELDRAKQAARNQVLSAHLLDSGRKFLGAGMYPDARASFLSAIRHRPSLLLQVAVVRHTFASLAGKRTYEVLKRLIKLRSNS